MSGLPIGPEAATQALGWLATTVFVGSYFFKRPEALVRAQMGGAVLWTAYGVLMKAPPVIAANLLVLAAAAWKSRRAARAAEPALAPRLADAYPEPRSPERDVASQPAT